MDWTAGESQNSYRQLNYYVSEDGGMGEEEEDWAAYGTEELDISDDGDEADLLLARIRGQASGEWCRTDMSG